MVTSDARSRTQPPRRSRREESVLAAARLFAERGFHGVTMEEIGASVGISGPGLYKHFASKDAVLAAMLIGISQDLLDEGRRRVADAACAEQALSRLLAFHTDFALTRPELIRVQDRDLANLSEAKARRVRRLQRAYIELWVGVLMSCDPSLDAAEARTRTHAVLGLLNSTPHSAATGDAEFVRPVLERMAAAALRG